MTSGACVEKSLHTIHIFLFGGGFYYTSELRFFQGSGGGYGINIVRVKLYFTKFHLSNRSQVLKYDKF